MEITNITIKKLEDQEKNLKAFASVTLNDSFVINDIRVIEGDKGLFIAMPSRKTPDGKFKDVAHPINQETRSMFEEKIFEAFNNAE